MKVIEGYVRHVIEGDREFLKGPQVNGCSNIEHNGLTTFESLQSARKVGGNVRLISLSIAETIEDAETLEGQGIVVCYSSFGEQKDYEFYGKRNTEDLFGEDGRSALSDNHLTPFDDMEETKRQSTEMIRQAYGSVTIASFTLSD